MSQRSPSSNAFRALMLIGAAALALGATPAFAAFHFHGGGHGGAVRPPMAFHDAHRDFHRRFDHGFGFVGFGYAPGDIYDDTGVDDPCLRRILEPYGWRVVNVCY